MDSLAYIKSASKVLNPLKIIITPTIVPHFLEKNAVSEKAFWSILGSLLRAPNRQIRPLVIIGIAIIKLTICTLLIQFTLK